MRTKNIIAIILLAIASMQAVCAQTDSTKTEAPKVHNSYLPVKGSFGIGADATPLFDFVGNMFNGNLNNSLDISTPLIYAKYYLTDFTALRMVVGVQNATNNQLKYSPDDAARLANPLSNADVTDGLKNSVNQYLVSVGVQKFIGEKRLRGFYGGQLFGVYDKDKSEYTYGNPMTSLNPTPNIAYLYTGGARTLSEVTIHDFKIGAGAIAGFEYYLMPQLCVGGEVSLNFIYTQNLQLYKKSEKMVGDKLTLVDKANAAGGHDFSILSSSFTPVAPGNSKMFQHVGLYVMLHF